MTFHTAQPNAADHQRLNGLIVFWLKDAKRIPKEATADPPDPAKNRIYLIRCVCAQNASNHQMFHSGSKQNCPKPARRPGVAQHSQKTLGIGKNIQNLIQHILNRPNSSRDLQISTNKHRILQKTPQINHKSYGITQNTIKTIQNHRRRTKNIPNPTKPIENIHFLMFFDILCRLLLFCDVSKIWPARNPAGSLETPSGSRETPSGSRETYSLDRWKPLWIGRNPL